MDRRRIAGNPQPTRIEPARTDSASPSPDERIRGELQQALDVAWQPAPASKVEIPSRNPRARQIRTVTIALAAVAAVAAVATVVLGTEDDGSVRLWEPAHGEVLAQARASHEKQDPGSRAYACAGLPGAEWWVADCANGPPHSADVELDDVDALYTENDLWSEAFDSNI